MDLRREFQAHADECHQMAIATRDIKSKATWKEMAERWARAAKHQAEMEEQARTVRRNRAPQRRQKDYGWMDNAIP
jgi:hypothetical protein